MIHATKEVTMNTPKVDNNTFSNLFGCLILAIDVVIVKKINGIIMTNNKFMNRSPKGLSTMAFSPAINPNMAPIIKAVNNNIVCL